MMTGLYRSRRHAGMIGMVVPAMAKGLLCRQLASAA